MELDLGVRPRPGWDVATVLITVKAYPVIGRRTGESVCVAGVRLDRGTPEWIRLFPVPFRAMAPERQFAKYTVVQLRVHRRDGSDRRPESYQPDLDSMRLGERLDTKRRSAARWEALGELAGATTACQLYAGAKQHAQGAPSLGLIKPESILAITVTDNPAYRPGSVAPAVEVDLFGAETEALEAQPFIVKVTYRCHDCGRGKHEQTIVDWETGRLGRRLLIDERRPLAEARDKVRDRYQDILGPKFDTHLYLGNQHQHPSSFLILGTFWPPAGSRPADTLF